MGLSEAAARITKESTARVLTIDIERVPGHAKHQHRGLTIEGDFWDLSGWKHILGYRIPPESVAEWPRTICAAWRWYGDKKTDFASEWGDGREGMLQRIWDAYDQADIVYGHNVDRFDTKNLKAEWLVLGLQKPSPFKIVDTLKVARAEFGFESNTLASLTQRLGIDTKTDKYDVATARAALAGDVKAQKKLRAYNVGDIAASEALVDRMRGWVPNHPHVASQNGPEDLRCNQCGSPRLTRQAKPTTAVLLRYSLYRCDDCGGQVRGSVALGRVGSTRGVR